MRERGESVVGIELTRFSTNKATTIKPWTYRDITDAIQQLGDKRLSLGPLVLLWDYMQQLNSNGLRMYNRTSDVKCKREKEVNSAQKQQSLALNGVKYSASGW